MKVILQQDVRGQGKKGQMIDAAEGYARNYLLPRKLAIPATADAINTMNLKEKARRAEEAANRAAAVETADKLRNCTVKITAKGGANGKLFGAITGKRRSPRRSWHSSAWTSASRRSCSTSRSRRSAATRSARSSATRSAGSSP